MNLLLLTPQLPYPPQQGTALRNLNLIDQLARRHTVDLLTFLAPGETLADDNPLHELCRRVGALPQPERSLAQRARDTLLAGLPDMALRLAGSEMHARVAEWCAETRYDIVQAEGIEMARYGLQVAGRGGTAPAQRPRFVFDDHNAEALLQQRNAQTDLRRPRRWPAAAYSLIQWRKLRAYEAFVCLRADVVLAVSAADAAALRRLAPGAQVEVVSNGIDLGYYTPEAYTPEAYTPEAYTPEAYTPEAAAPGAPGAQRVLFTGKMDYRPNIDAVLWFAREVLPRVLARRPRVRFQIVGRNPHPRLDALRADPAIEITGAVEDVRPYIQQAGVYAIPLRVGGGTRFKALEAMACARPIVSTRLGVEGIGVRHGSEMLLADSPEAFADAVLTLLEPGNDALREHLAENARRFVEAHYDWEPIVARLETIYAALLPA